MKKKECKKMKLKDLAKSLSIIFMLLAMMFSCVIEKNNGGGTDSGGSGNSGGSNSGGNSGGSGGGNGGGGGSSPADITITFDLNGAEGTQPDAITTKAGESVLLPTLDNDNFSHWNTQADGCGTKYDGGTNATFKQNVTLYAILSYKAGITITQKDPEITLTQERDGNIVTFTTVPGFSSYKWYIEGTEQSETSNTLKVDITDKEHRIYKVTVVLSFNGQYYSETATLKTAEDL